MIPRLRQLAIAAVSGVLLMLPGITGTLPGTTGVAHAAAAPPDYVYSEPLAASDAEMRKVAEYWKPEKLKDADSYSPATPGTKSSSPSSSPSTSAGSLSPQAIARTRAPRDIAPTTPAKGGAARTIGKVYFQLGGKEYWCSASAVAARNRSLVATAGHCAWDPRLGKSTNWIFVPNPGKDGEAPDGIYVGSTLHMHEDWAAIGDYDYDYAFVSVHRGFRWTTENGKLAMKDVGRLEDNIGGLGLTVGKKTGNQISAFGYPAGAQPDNTHPFDGRTLKTCEGTTKRTVNPTRNLQWGVLLPGCDFSTGASGGPWMLGYKSSTRLGYLNGVNSLTWNLDAVGKFDAVSSPYFTTTTFEVYDHAANDSLA
ncbi:trypsin-like serine peptidase [Nonomuraea sp. NPDC004354]